MVLGKWHSTVLDGWYLIREECPEIKPTDIKPFYGLQTAAQNTDDLGVGGSEARGPGFSIIYMTNKQ